MPGTAAPDAGACCHHEDGTMLHAGMVRLMSLLHAYNVMSLSIQGRKTGSGRPAKQPSLLNSLLHMHHNLARLAATAVQPP